MSEQDLESQHEHQELDARHQADARIASLESRLAASEALIAAKDAEIERLRQALRSQAGSKLLPTLELADCVIHMKEGRTEQLCFVGGQPKSDQYLVVESGVARAKGLFISDQPERCRAALAKLDGSKA